jgi:hypothetical protein
MRKMNDNIAHKVWNIVENTEAVFLFHQEYVFYQRNYKDLVVHQVSVKLLIKQEKEKFHQLEEQRV